MASGRSRLGPAFAAIAVLAATAGAVVLLMRLERTRATERVAAEAQAAALRAADGVRSVIGGLEGQTQNATTNPRLVAALDANVDQETLRDLLLTEPWWEPYRRGVDAFGLYGDESTALVTSHLPAAFDARTMVRDARQGHHASSGLLPAGAQVLAVAACPVALTGRSSWPVLVGAKRLDAGVVSGMAERAGGAVAISDGRRVLVAAAAGASGGDDDVAALRQATDVSAPGLATIGEATVAALPLTGGLRVMVAVTPPPIAAGGLPLPWSGVVILVAGVLFAVLLFVILSRQAAEPVAALVPANDQGLSDDVAMIGRYTIVERIGQGGMADIYAAVTTGDGNFRRPVVIKRLRPELSIDPNAVAQFCDEANLLATLHHPNIVAVHDFGRSQNQYYLAEEYVVGRDLGRLVARRLELAGRPPPVEVIAYIGVELLKALEYAHGLTNEMGRSLGIVHRDVSPENVMVSARGEVKLLDFGVVKAAEGRLTRTEVGVVKGNVTYMAPEQARGLEVDSRADLYALGLVLYTLAAGRPLYVGDTTYGLLMKAGAGPGVEDRSAIRELPPPLAAIVDRATATRIEDRFQDARAMATALEGAARGGAVATAALVVELFGAELREESHRMATFAPPEPARTIAGLSSV